MRIPSLATAPNAYVPVAGAVTKPDHRAITFAAGRPGEGDPAPQSKSIVASRRTTAGASAPPTAWSPSASAV
jgi:hypothetical protein